MLIALLPLFMALSRVASSTPAVPVYEELESVKAKMEKKMEIVNSYVEKLKGCLDAVDTKIDKSMASKSNGDMVQGHLDAIRKKIDDSVATLNSHVQTLQRQVDTMQIKTGTGAAFESHGNAVQVQLDEMTKKIALLEQHDYFLAIIQPGTSKVAAGTVVFDKVLANTGGVYDPRTGIFTAPRSGLYAITVQAFARDSSDGNWDLYVNGKQVLRAKIITQGDTSSDYVYPVILKPGDRINVNNRGTLKIYGFNHSIFGGWLIRAI